MIVTAVDAATAYVVTAKVAVALPDGTVTVAGTVAAAGLLLARSNAIPPAGARAVSVTVPMELVPPVTVAGLTVAELSLAGTTDVTVRSTVCVDPP